MKYYDAEIDISLFPHQSLYNLNTEFAVYSRFCNNY